ncbi:MAG: GGDEF domain-containing protein [Acidobacteriota bacterium]|nr:diguanylate cyclase [Blastocatellia bacterium]MDW8412147.1 GGDEF domain-containing protein [Acidobacteriota bacterium]
MDSKKETKTFGDQTVEFQISEWVTPSGKDGFYFTVIEGPDFGRVFLLEQPETIVGRSDEADIQVDDEKVSRKHLKISLSKSSINGDTLVIVSDLNSKNGIFVNGVRTLQQQLRNGDKIKIGDTILKFETKDLLDVHYHDKLYRQATRDPLTGLANRSYFQNEIQKTFSIASRHNRVFSIMMMDIDFFKKINDTFGHDVGDNVLRKVADILMKHLRAHDVAARYGGEEFIILLPETPLSGALTVAERIRLAVEAFNFEIVGCSRKVTVSSGIADYPACAKEPDELIKRADEALYQAKTSGRNRVCTAPQLAY